MNWYQKDACCLKCLNKEISSRWHRDHCPMRNNSYSPCSETKNEHILRICDNCGFQWIEKPMDIKE